jgi:hypothetical protein
MSAADPVTDAARQWLERFVGMYAGMDTGSEHDPVHTARVRAQECLDAGPKPSDPFTVAGMMIDALPGDPRANTLALPWLEDYVRALRQLAGDD